MEKLKDQIWQALKTVPYPGYNRDIVSFGLVQRVAECDGLATISLDMSQLPEDVQEELAASIRETLQSLPGLQTLQIDRAKTLDTRPRLARQKPERGPRPEGVARVVAVGSGKGGVGKSTVAVNLAAALAKQGLRVGLMDADAYGPNVPRMMGATELPAPRNGKIQPAEAHGVRLVSIGFMVQAEAPLVWRGPMTDKMIRQFLDDVEWGSLDLLLVDLPPTTGDIPISLTNHTHVDGAVLVVTPQDVALDDARKAAGMFQRMEVPILGLVENMSYFVCSQCSTHHDLFGQGGGKRLAQELGIPFMGQIPLEPNVRAGGDQGLPAVLQAGSLAGAALEDQAQQLWQRIQER